MLNDLRYAVRHLRRTLAFSAAVVLTLALGIGLDTTVFSVAYGVLMRPLPYPDADRIVHLARGAVDEPVRVGQPPTVMLTTSEFTEWERRARVFESVAIFSSMQTPVAGAGEPGLAVVAGVSSRFFDVFRMPARIGR